ncbi:MAG TPA: VWA domain-containing protein [Natrialbaceae archaeon]|nr:VWA domain-containing protein [Natrialbaceae archaeon]
MTNRSRRQVLRLGALVAAGGLAGCASLSGDGGAGTTGRPTDAPTDVPPTDGTPTPTQTKAPPGQRIDDWQYDPKDLGQGGGKGGSGGSKNASATYTAMATNAPSSGNVGLAAGGAKDVVTFRRNVEEGFLPIPSSIPYEGLFYDYYFDTGGSGNCNATFCPAYSPAVSEDPLADETERYFTVGLDSGLSQSEFSRKKLNLVVVLDVSGSMSSSFDEYYYDRFGNKKEVENHTDDPKIEVAKEALASLTEQLRPGDRFGVVLYNNESTVAKPLNPVAETDMDAIRGHIEEDIEAGGGTRLSGGLTDAEELLAEYADADQREWENRMIVLTDAMPNLGDTDEGSLEETLEGYAEDSIHTTFVGVGVDFNTEIVDGITSVRGANYYSVHSADEFEQRVADEFEYMVTPLVYDLQLELDAPEASVAKVYGSTAAEDATEDLVKVNTLFPSPKREGKAKGGVVLVKLADAAGSELDLTASWVTRDGKTHETTETVAIPDRDPDYYANSGIHKAVLLTRYADLMKSWMIAEREGDDEAPVSKSEGIEPPEDDYDDRWEQQSEPLTVSETYRERFDRFAGYFRDEMNALGDESLEQELELLRKLADYDG